MIVVIRSGRNPTMRYLKRTHGVSVSWLHERFKEPDLQLVYELSAKMAADIYTKGFLDPQKWELVCGLINIIDPKILKIKVAFQGLIDNSTAQRGGESVDQKQPPPPEGLPSKPGKHEEDLGRPILVANQPRQFRTPERFVDPKIWPYRSTWVLKNGGWTNLEVHVEYALLPDPRGCIKHCVEKGIFRFECDLKAAAAGTGTIPGTSGAQGT